MSDVTDRERASEYWDDLAGRLRREIAAGEDPGANAALRLALLRLLAGRLGRHAEAAAELESLLGEGDASLAGDLPWEDLGFAAGRDSRSRARALERLSRAVEDPEIRNAAHVFLSRLLAADLADPADARSRIGDVLGRDPDHRPALWLLLLDELESRGDLAAAPPMDRLRGLTADRALGVALALELAAIAGRREGGSDEAASLHEQALALEFRDWWQLNRTARDCAAMGREDLAVLAWERLALAADEPAPAAEPHLPAGHSFDGIERGNRAAAVAWWMSALLRERRLDDPQGALVAIENAADHLPGSALLRTERARLRRITGTDGAAAEIDHADLVPAERCALALAAGLEDRVRGIAGADPSAAGSAVIGAFVEATGSAADEAEDAEDRERDPAAWLAAHPDHPEARNVAARLLAEGQPNPVADLVAAEGPSDSPWWTGAAPEGTAGWYPLIRALERALGGEVADGLGALAESVRAPEARAPLFLSAALSAEARGDLDKALELGRAAAALAPGDRGPTALLLRVLRRTRGFAELADLLAALAAEAADPAVAAEAALERSLLLEYALGTPAEAVPAVHDLAAAVPPDAFAAFCELRLALRLADWDRAVGAIDRLAEQAPADGPRLELLAGELLLLTLGRDAEAAERFDRAGRGLPEPLATAARLYGIHSARERGDGVAFEALLAEQAERGPRDVWLPESTDAAHANRRAEGVAGTQPAADGGEPDAARLLWNIIAAPPGGGPGGVAGVGLLELGRRVGPGPLAGACRTAAMLLGAPAADGGGADADGPEALWHAAERCRPGTDPELRAGLAAARAADLAGGDPLIRADWLLLGAEALEDAGRFAEGLALIRDGMERLPDHPGLLEARARLAEAAGEFGEAAESHDRLAVLYASPDEKATQLSRAAVLRVDGLGDEEGGERLLRDALKLAPGHALANELLERLLHERGDDSAIVEQLEERIAAELDTETLIRLYQEQSDRLLAIEDTEGALEAIENILLLDRDNAAVHRTKIDLLASFSRFREAVEALDEFAAATADPVEKRTSVWRAAEIRAMDLDDLDGALDSLRAQWDAGDEHPQTLRLTARLAEHGARWELAAQSLRDLAGRIPEPAKRAGVVRELARILLEHLFEDEEAERLLDEVLEVDPTDIAAMGIALQFKTEEKAQSMLSRAEAGLQEQLDGDPLNLETISRLREISELLERGDAVEACLEAIAVINGATPLDQPGDDAPAAGTNAARLGEIVLHADERGSAASLVARMAAPLTGEVFAAAEGFPSVPRKAFLGRPAEDPLAAWILRWSTAAGIERIDIARHGEDPRGSVTLPGEAPAVVINPDLALPLEARARFFLVRHVWRAGAGLGAFHEGDQATPLRWILAVAAACLGDGAALPLPTDKDLVDRARKAMPRKLRKALIEPCQGLLASTPQQLRAWTAGTSFSADRFGLLAVGDLAGTVNWIVEESAGPNGLRRLGERPADTISKVPRCRQIVRFVLSPGYLEARTALGLSKAGGAS